MKQTKRNEKKHLGYVHTIPVVRTLRCRLQSTTRTSKSNRFNRQNKSSAHASRFFLYISLPSLHDCDGKIPNFTFNGGHK